MRLKFFVGFYVGLYVKCMLSVFEIRYDVCLH